MAAIAATQVTLVKGTDHYEGNGTHPRESVAKRLTITGVTAADTATPAVLGMSKVVEAHSAIYAGTPNVPLLVGVDYATGGIIIGAGPANVTIHVTVVGTPTLRVG